MAEKINEKRNASFARKSSPELVRFYKARTLASACAEYHLRKRGDFHLVSKEG